MSKPVACKHCGEPIRRCHCQDCGTPGWTHHLRGTIGYHRCGPDGVGATFAEPAP